MGCHAQPPKWCVVFHLCYIFLSSSRLTVNVMRPRETLLSALPHPLNTSTEHETTPSLVCFRVRRLPMHAEHETTPTLVYFRARHLAYPLQWMPSTKPHPRWCVFVFGTFLRPPMHAEHETTPTLVCFCARHLSYPSNGCQA